jgi:flavodoxin
MRTLVVYDSIYGNTEIVARAVAEQISGEVRLLRAGQVSAGDLLDLDLLVVGSPTHGSLPSEAVQALLTRIGAPARQGARAATFDTRLSWRFLKRYGYAADKIAGALEGKGWALAGEPGGFFVRGLKKGPLKKGEAARAAAWAKGLAAGQA